MLIWWGPEQFKCHNSEEELGGWKHIKNVSEFCLQMLEENVNILFNY